MSVKLNRLSYANAQKLIRNRQCVLDERSDWTDHRPARRAAEKFIEQRGFAEYAKWHLGEDDEEPEGNKRRYKFPMGTSIMFIAVRYSLPRRAGQYKHADIELAAAHLHGMLEKLMAIQHPEAKGARTCFSPLRPQPLQRCSC
jgi:hypothetical protein